MLDPGFCVTFFSTFVWVLADDLDQVDGYLGQKCEYTYWQSMCWGYGIHKIMCHFIDFFPTVKFGSLERLNQRQGFKTASILWIFQQSLKNP
jgi:hypothetical protein